MHVVVVVVVGGGLGALVVGGRGARGGGRGRRGSRCGRRGRGERSGAGGRWGPGRRGGPARPRTSPPPCAGVVPPCRVGGGDPTVVWARWHGRRRGGCARRRGQARAASAGVVAAAVCRPRRGGDVRVVHALCREPRRRSTGRQEDQHGEQRARRRPGRRACRPGASRPAPLPQDRRTRRARGLRPFWPPSVRLFRPGRARPVLVHVVSVPRPPAGGRSFPAGDQCVAASSLQARPSVTSPPARGCASRARQTSSHGHCRAHLRSDERVAGPRPRRAGAPAGRGPRTRSPAGGGSSPRGRGGTRRPRRTTARGACRIGAGSSAWWPARRRCRERTLMRTLLLPRNTSSPPGRRTHTASGIHRYGSAQMAAPYSLTARSKVAVGRREGTPPVHARAGSADRTPPAARRRSRAGSVWGRLRRGTRRATPARTRRTPCHTPSSTAPAPSTSAGSRCTSDSGTPKPRPAGSLAQLRRPARRWLSACWVQWAELTAR